MENKAYSFKELNAYKEAKELVKDIYGVVQRLPQEERYALADQLRRAVISITSNIAEGSGRMTIKDQSHFYTMAYGSLMEVLAQLDVACDLGYITKEEFQHIENLVDIEAKLLTGLINKRNSSVASSKQ